MSIVERNRRLRNVYARLPEIKCKGLCHEACGPVAQTQAKIEERAMLRVLGAELTHDPKTLTCSALGADNRCRGYEARPLICRIFGVAEELQCPHGCVAERLLTKEESLKLFAEVENIWPRSRE